MLAAGFEEHLFNIHRGAIRGLSLLQTIKRIIALQAHFRDTSRTNCPFDILVRTAPVPPAHPPKTAKLGRLDM